MLSGVRIYSLGYPSPPPGGPQIHWGLVSFPWVPDTVEPPLPQRGTWHRFCLSWSVTLHQGLRDALRRKSLWLREAQAIPVANCFKLPLGCALGFFSFSCLWNRGAGDVCTPRSPGDSPWEARRQEFNSSPFLMWPQGLLIYFKNTMQCFNMHHTEIIIC